MSSDSTVFWLLLEYIFPLLGFFSFLWFFPLGVLFTSISLYLDERRRILREQHPIDKTKTVSYRLRQILQRKLHRLPEPEPIEISDPENPNV